MKKSLIALAVAAGSIAAAQAQDSTTLYGSLGFSSVISQAKINTISQAGRIISGIKDTHWDIGTSSAKIGVKGQEDLGNGMQAFFKFEFGANTSGSQLKVRAVDSNDNLVVDKDNNPVYVTQTINEGLSAVNYAYLGLKGDFGTVTIGKQKSLLKAVTDTGVFQEVGIGYDNNGSYVGTVSKAISYVTPESAGLQLGASVVADNNNFDSKGADAWEVAAMYNVDGWNTGLVYTHDTKGIQTIKNGKTEVTGNGSNEFIGANVGYSTDQYNLVGRVVHEASVSTEYGIEGEYMDGPNTFRAGFGVYDPKASGQKNTYNAALGYQYNFSQRTYTWVEGQYTKDNTKGFKAVVGIRHDF